MVSKSVVGLHRPVLFKTEKLLCGSGRLCCGVPVTERFHWYDRVWPCGERYHWRYFNPNILLNPWQYKSAFTAYGTIIKKQKTRKNPNGVHFILGNASLQFFFCFFFFFFFKQREILFQKFCNLGPQCFFLIAYFSVVLA